MEGFKPFGWYLTLVQFGFYSMFGLVELQLTQDKRRRYSYQNNLLLTEDIVKDIIYHCCVMLLIKVKDCSSKINTLISIHLLLMLFLKTW